jgi:DNA-directed RNA polymerase specialized sigma24 family protein
LHAALLCGDPRQAQDPVQTVLARGYRHWRPIEHDDPYGYFVHALTNAVIDWWRLSHRRYEVPSDVPNVTAAPSAAPPRKT